MGHLRTPPPTTPADTGTVPSLAEVASLSRDELIDRLLHFPGCCHLDFSEGFLAAKSTDKLRHILIAACQHAGKPRS